MRYVTIKRATLNRLVLPLKDVAILWSRMRLTMWKVLKNQNPDFEPDLIKQKIVWRLSGSEQVFRNLGRGGKGVRRVLVFLLCVSVLEAKPLSQVKKLYLKKAVVSIEVSVHQATSANIGSYVGTGFLCHKEGGLILTNRHIANPNIHATYTVILWNGKKLEASYVYADPWHDFAFLRLKNPQDLDSSIHALDRFGQIKLDQTIFMIGNNQGQDFPYRRVVSLDLFQNVGFLPEPAFGLRLMRPVVAVDHPFCQRILCCWVSSMVVINMAILCLARKAYKGSDGRCEAGKKA